MNYKIREMKQSEYKLLNDFLYKAIFQKDKTNLVPKTVINEPILQLYIKDFGTMKDDYCLCAEVNKKIVGAVWVRNIEGYGNIDNKTPELAVSVYENYRGYGIGTKMIKNMLELLKNNGYKKTSLSVQKDNYALNMYVNIGFKIVNENTEEFIMEYTF